MFAILASFLIAQLTPVLVTVNARGEAKPISPYIYGMNNALSAWTGQATSVEFVRLRDSGVRLFRDNGGNNSTKYNWRLRLSSHPDWYNNVYTNDWDHRAQLIADHFPDAKGLFGFQLIGKAAKTDQHNFNDWGYNQSQWWPGVHNNWAGGGGPQAGDGNPDLYLMDWPADSTVGILNHWFGEGGLGLDPDQFPYWNMDNEPEIWNGTHDDVMPSQLSAEAFMQRYFDVAKKARAQYPEIKLVGPSPANEWQWYNWTGGTTYEGRHHSWLEYFIRRIGEEQEATGIRLLDVLDVHFYPYETRPEDVVQLHRVWFDTSYDYPGANGVKSINGGWNANLTKEYLFERCRQWLDQYLGAGHGVTFGVTETAVPVNDPDLVAVWYASQLGVFADHGVEVFTPWDWKLGMWEVLHLFSRNAKSYRVPAESSGEPNLSAHASLNASGDSLTVILINRSLTTPTDVALSFEGFDVRAGAHPLLTLADLPIQETFFSKEENALVRSTASAADNSVSVTLPALSVSALVLTGTGPVITPGADELQVFPNPFSGSATLSYHLAEGGQATIEVFDMAGRRVLETRGPSSTPRLTLDAGTLPSGVYVVRITVGDVSVRRVVTIVR